MRCRHRVLPTKPDYQVDSHSAPDIASTPSLFLAPHEVGTRGTCDPRSAKGAPRGPNSDARLAISLLNLQGDVPGRRDTFLVRSPARPRIHGIAPDESIVGPMRLPRSASSGCHMVGDGRATNIMVQVARHRRQNCKAQIQARFQTPTPRRTMATLALRTGRPKNSLVTPSLRARRIAAPAIVRDWRTLDLPEDPILFPFFFPYATPL